jgi:hypothetical protein
LASPTPEVPEEEVGEGDASAQRPGKRQRVQKEGAAGRQASGGFDPIALHRPFCPWVSTGVGEAKNLRCGWMRVLEALHRGSAGAAPETAALTPQVDNEQTEEGQTVRVTLTTTHTKYVLVPRVSTVRFCVMWTE